VSRPIHCLLIHQAFAGPGEPGGTRHFEIGRLLAGAGHRFTVIAGSVSYLTGEMVNEDVEEERVTVVREWRGGDRGFSEERERWNVGEKVLR